MSQLSVNDSQTLDRFRSYLYLLARTHLSPGVERKLEASDLVQQTLMDAYTNRDQFRGESAAQLAAWLRQILKRNLVDAMRNMRREKRDIRRERRLESAVHDSFVKVDGWLARTGTSPSMRISTEEQLLRLPGALQQLPAAQAEAIVLHHLRGMRLAEIATQLGRSEKAVGGLLYRGIKKLHALLADV